MDTEVVGLGRYVAAIRRRLWVVLATTLVFAVGVTAYVEARPAPYRATAQVLIKPYSTASFAEAPFTTAQVDTQVAVMQSLAVVRGAVALAGLGESPTTLQKSITAAAIGDTSIIEITVSRDSATDSATIANALARSYVTFREQALPPNVKGSFATIVGYAQPPTHRSGPKLLTGGIFGLVIGLVIGCLLALVVDRRGRTLVDEAAISDATGRLPVLGRIPRGRRRSRGPSRAEARGSPEHVAYGFLATTVRLLRGELTRTGTPGPTIVLVVSAGPGDGRTSVAANMALAAADAGGRTLVCDADLTEPGLTTLFGVADEVTLEALVRRRLPLGLDMLARPAPNVYALGTGAASTSLAALLGNGSLRALAGRFPSTLDLVIVDTSPLLSSADVLHLVPQADVVLLVVRERYSKRADVEAGLERIRQVGVAVAGIVVTDSRASVGTQRPTRRQASVATVDRSASEPAESDDSTTATKASKT